MPPRLFRSPPYFPSPTSRSSRLTTKECSGSASSGRWSETPSGPGHDLETRVGEVAVEREGPFQAMAAHQDERNAVGEADLLVGELREQFHGGRLVIGVGPQNGQFPAFIP